jgi:hypothetical protein
MPAGSREDTIDRRRGKQAGCAAAHEDADDFAACYLGRLGLEVALERL